MACIVGKCELSHGKMWVVPCGCQKRRRPHHPVPVEYQQASTQTTHAGYAHSALMPDVHTQLQHSTFRGINVQAALVYTECRLYIGVKLLRRKSLDSLPRTPGSPTITGMRFFFGRRPAPESPGACTILVTRWPSCTSYPSARHGSRCSPGSESAVGRSFAPPLPPFL